jgi:hypothetical protein
MTPGVEDGLDDLARGVERAPGHRGHGRAQHGEIAAAVADGQRVGRRYAMVSGHFKHRHRLGAGRRTQFEITLPLHKPNAGIRAQAGGLSARFRGFVGIGKLQADMPRRDGCRAARCMAFQEPRHKILQNLSQRATAKPNAPVKPECRGNLQKPQASTLPVYPGMAGYNDVR